MHTIKGAIKKNNKDNENQSRAHVQRRTRENIGDGYYRHILPAVGTYLYYAPTLALEIRLCGASECHTRLFHDPRTLLERSIILLFGLSMYFSILTVITQSYN
jgi:hypothetical protein